MFSKANTKLTSVIVAVAILMASSTTTNAATTYDAPSNSEFKSYMDHDAITNKTSAQYALKPMCTTTENGLRIYNGRYCIAIGTGYNAPVGTYVDVALDTGVVLQCVVADIKADCDTYSNNLQDKNNNSVVEFVVDSDLVKKSTNRSGSISTLEHFGGGVESITVYSDEDMASLNWEPVVSDFEETNSYLVTDKYVLTIGSIELYIVEYAASTDFNTIEVTKDVYDSLVINTSTISL